MSMPTLPSSKQTPPAGGRGSGRRVRILIVDGDAHAAGAVADILRAEDWDVAWAHTGAAALERVRLEGVDAVVADMRLPDMDGPALCRALREHSEMAAIPIVALSTSGQVADRVAALRAGASDFLVKPPDAVELVARLQAALDLQRGRSGTIVAVLGAKGGVGASILAANLALALRQQTHATVALADLAQTCCLDVLLNLQARLGVTDLLARAEELEPGDLETILTPHASGVEALLPGAEGSGVLAPEQARKALLALRRARDLTVVDVSPWPREVLAATIELADRLLIVLTPEITGLREATRLVQEAGQLGLARERMMLVLNRFPLRGGLQRRDVEGAVGLPVSVEIPNDVSLITYSTNRGVPLVSSHPRSRVARSIATAARSIAQAAGPR